MMDIRRYQLPDYWGYKIFVVRGELVRDELDREFSSGANGRRCSYVPDDEIWLDDELPTQEHAAILRREAVEANLRTQGMSGDQARGFASKAEQLLRGGMR